MAVSGEPGYPDQVSRLREMITMSRAAASRVTGDAGALDELEFHWGSAYHLAVVDGMCTARRRDGRGGTLADPLPEGLRLLILADYEACPVPRDLP